MKPHSSLFLAMLIPIAACGSSAVTPVDSAGDQASDTAALETAVDQPADNTPATCLEFPGCEKLIYGRDGCPIRCDVNGSLGDASDADFAHDQRFGTAAASDGGCDTDAAGCF